MIKPIIHLAFLLNRNRKLYPVPGQDHPRQGMANIITYSLLLLQQILVNPRLARMLGRPAAADHRRIYHAQWLVESTKGKTPKTAIYLDYIQEEIIVNYVLSLLLFQT